MNCLKCGQEISEGNVFCQNCQVDMDKCPVPPGTVVLLPRRKESSPSKKSVKRHTQSAEEQLAVLRRRMVYLVLLLVLCITAIAVMYRPAMHYIRDEHIPIGQNYSSVTPANIPADEE